MLVTLWFYTIKRNKRERGVILGAFWLFRLVRWRGLLIFRVLFERFGCIRGREPSSAGGVEELLGFAVED
jgi:hypothetical protein